MALQPKLHLSFEEWLAEERTSLGPRTEYFAGKVFAMAGASATHNTIVSNLSGLLWTQMKGRPCQVFANDMKVRIRTSNNAAYPDLVAFRDRPEFLDEQEDVLLNPSLIVEVLSDSTEARDRGGKFALYRQIPSLQEYLLVLQHQIQAELFTRQEEGRWALRDFTTPADCIPLRSIDCTLTLAQIFDKVRFPAVAA